VVVEEAERLTRLINAVLDLAKLESGGAQWRIETVGVAQLLETSAQATAQLFRDRGVTLELEPCDAAPAVLADRDRVVQVVVNLLSNAVKFCDPGTGRVWLGLHVEDDAVRVEVRDNGPGVAAADQQAIFEKFRQGGAAGSDRPPGTGLGLPISREIIGRLGGRLWVDSEPGGGATFSFTLPLAAGRAPAATGAETEG
jgi:signal transduction histidine kinase